MMSFRGPSLAVLFTKSDDKYGKIRHTEVCQNSRNRLMINLKSTKTHQMVFWKSVYTMSLLQPLFRGEST